jgi:hypothetical protein
MGGAGTNGHCTLRAEKETHTTLRKIQHVTIPFQSEESIQEFVYLLVVYGLCSVEWWGDYEVTIST